MSKIVSIFVILAIFLGSEAHVRMMLPPSRSSLWRFEEFKVQNPPINYDDDGLYCGQIHQWPEVETCGLCGDPFVDPTPRDNEHGGKYGQGIIARNYSAGQTIEINLEYTTAHMGQVEFQLCEGLPETEECFLKNILVVGDGASTLTPIPENGGEVNKTIHAQLPPGITCDHCILRMNYRAGNNWGDCRNGTESMGCGLQETFRHCSDITIN